MCIRDSLRRDHALPFEELHELRLARDRLLLEDAQDAVLPLRPAERRHQRVPRAPTSSANSARTECIRLVACGHTTDWGPSITSGVTSSPRCAGRQWRNTASGAA